jgi:hypothetical protein
LAGVQAAERPANASTSARLIKTAAPQPAGHGHGLEASSDRSGQLGRRRLAACS